ncbi:GEVED domain-containing protein [Nonlabens xiamenensis]|uniref:GEVED domain-containing protein n=1 Tax=Nonlabens xiamenensis TaxID=2341043 RepID=UPI000F60923F|nr:GEVED domain-containing protein [Nonlabens xiamenensis]
MKNITLWVAVSLIAFSCITSTAQTQKQRQQMTSRMDLNALNSLEQRFKTISLEEKEKAVAFAKANNLPLRTTLEDGTLVELQKVVDGQPIYYTTFNVAAARSTRTNYLHNNGGLGLNVEGQNMTGYIWDGGLARSTHQEYDGPGGNNRFSIGDGTSTLNFHAAHVTGTVIAYGAQPNAKGMAPRASAVGHDWNNDKSEATAQAASGMLLSNHSYGYAFRDRFGRVQLPDYFFGGYIQESRDWDEIMFNAPYYMMVVAGGNDGNDNTADPSPLDGNSNYNKLTGSATSKNNLVIANAQDASINGDGSLNSVTINSGSSEGPTDDYRIKPDLTGNGTGVYSSYESSDTAYASISGTSMASPNVMGSLLLLQQHYNNLNGSFMRAASLKGLALHTADDAGPVGPDPVYGWGLMNAKRAAEAITDNGNGSTISELTLNSGQSYEITVTASGLEDLMASISWTDRPGDATTSVNVTSARLVNDLDIRIIQSGTTYNPWRLTGVTTNGKGDNTRDPFERVEVSNPSGTYTIRVTHKGSLTGGSQNYSLIITGATTQAPVCNATTPTGLNLSGASSTDASLAWNAVAGASYDFRFRESGSTTWTNRTAGTSSISISGLNPNTNYEAQVRSRCADGSLSSYSSSLSFATTAVSYCSANGNNTNDEYISRVVFNSIDQTSGAGTGGYSNFTNLSTTVSKGADYSISVTPTWTGTQYNEAYAAWIDYNQDGDFGDAGEQVWSLAASQVSPATGSISIPQGAVNGTTRMRIIMRYNTSPSACGSFDYGEVEDYSVEITDATADTTAPSVPTGLSVSNLEQTSAGITWNASTDNVGVTAYDVYLNGNLIGETPNASVNITGLTASTSYTVQVAAKDAAGNTSALSSALSFTTASAPGSGCANGANLPYSQGFENGLGGWAQSTADDHDWTRTSGGTPSRDTGPTSAAEGSFYMFVEASSPYNNGRTAHLVSPCIDLAGATDPRLGFRYHMLGVSTMGDLIVSISEDDGASWNQLWSRTGSQGSAWNTGNVDLATYAGKSVRLRFTGTTTNQWRGDVAIDAISVTDGATSTDTAVNLQLNFDDYPEETRWTLVNGNGTTVASGGTYASQADGSTLNIPINLPADCYTLTVFDSASDGMCCGYGNGSYSLTSNGSVLASGASFGSTDVNDFCVGGSSPTSYTATVADTSSEISIYPNPVKDGLLFINLAGAQEANYQIFAINGKAVQDGVVKEQLNISELSAGMYLIQLSVGEQTVTKRFIKE